MDAGNEGDTSRQIERCLKQIQGNRAHSYYSDVMIIRKRNKHVYPDSAFTLIARRTS